MTKPVFSIRPLPGRTPFAAALASAVLLAACAAPPPPPPRQPPRRASVPPPRVVSSSGWVGTYRGTVPCGQVAASICQSKVVELTLLSNNSYRLETTMRRAGPPYTIVSNGRFQWDASGTVATLASKDENARLRVVGNQLERLPGINDDSEDPSTYRGYVLYKQ